MINYCIDPKWIKQCLQFSEEFQSVFPEMCHDATDLILDLSHIDVLRNDVWMKDRFGYADNFEKIGWYCWNIFEISHKWCFVITGKATNTFYVIHFKDGKSIKRNNNILTNYSCLWKGIEIINVLLCCFQGTMAIILFIITFSHAIF